MAPLSLLLALTFSLLPLSLSQSQCSSKTLNNRLYSACNELPHLSAALHYTFNPSTSSLHVAFSAPPAGPGGWIAWALNPTGTGMAGSQTLVAFKQPDGKMGVKTYNITGYAPLQEGPISYRVSDLEAEYDGGVMRIFATLRLGTGEGVVNEVWQVGSSVVNGVPAKHAFAPENLAAAGTLDLIRGESSGGGGVDSALKKKNIHGVLNAVSWGILLPIGAIIARYLKTFKSADPAWFYLHVSCQIIGYGVGVAGWATGLNLGSKSKGIVYSTHRNIGITLFSLGTLQEHSESSGRNPPSIPDNPMHLDIQASPINESQTKEHGSLREDFAPKVRKPYTITKQRERWTEEEHGKFLEALQLYGRAWRRIEEHIGTKTAVQIRSHAQKFFSKVVRESASNDTGHVKAIEIPPPRPKRKPTHPYPRKLGNFSTSEGLTIGRLGISSSSSLSLSEHENGSPTSVLSAFGSDTVSSFLSNLPSNCTSSLGTSAGGSNEQDASTEYKEASSKHALVPCLKLFGRTVVPNSKSLPNVNINERRDEGPLDIEPQALPLHKGALNGDFLSPAKSQSPWSLYGDAMNPIEPRITLPWWAWYGNLPLSFLHQKNPSLAQFIGQPCDRVMQKECLWSHSNAVNLKFAENGDDGNKRGFVPYKRCVMERRGESTQEMSDDGEDQSIGLCL